MGSPGLSPSDFKALVASMPRDKPLLPEVTSMLQNIVETLQEQWICDFLFTDETVHVQPFTSSEFIPLSFTGELQVTRVGALPLQPSHRTTPHPVDERIQKSVGRYLFSHLATLGQTAVGVGVLEFAATIETTQGRETPPSLSSNHDMRFVQDSGRQSMLIVFDNPKDDQLMIQSCISDTRRSCYIMRSTFRRREIIDIILKRRETLNVNMLFTALLGFVHTSRLRICPICNAGPAAGCTCFSRLVPVQAPDNLFDPQMFQFAMAHERGDYQGLTSKVLYDRGKRVRSVKLGAHISFGGGFDANVAHRLRSWALTKFARGVKENPRQSLRLLEPKNRTGQVGGCRAKYQGDEIVHENEPNAIQELEPLLDELKSLTIDNEEDHSGPTTQGGEDHALVLCQQMTSTSYGSSPAWLSDQQNVAVDWFKSPLNCRETNCAVRHDGGVGTPTAEARSVFLALPLKHDAIGDVGSAGLGVAPGFSLEENIGQGSVLQELQAAKRRVRNRASAHRSNQRKRAIRDKIAGDLKAAKERSEALMLDEMKLRTENMELRRQVGNLLGNKSLTL